MKAMNHKEYNRKVVAHLFDLLETACADRWHMVFDTNYLDQKQLLEEYTTDNVLLLNFHPTACRNFHLGDEYITVNVSLGMRPMHLVLPFTAIRGIHLEMEEGNVSFVPAQVMIMVPVDSVDLEEPITPADEPIPLPENVIQLFGKNPKPTTKES
jgi:stringent starvation protein B